MADFVCDCDCVCLLSGHRQVRAYKELEHCATHTVRQPIIDCLCAARCAISLRVPSFLIST